MYVANLDNHYEEIENQMTDLFIEKEEVDANFF